MNVTLPPEQQEWLEAQVTAGHFSSINEALAVAVAGFMALDSNDLTWAKPYLDQARASLARGDVVSGDEYLDRLKSKIETLRSS